jgi:2-dehydro-3-deoxy-D-gluconate 5-dehydrogenase
VGGELFSLDGRVALVTGGNGGIGRAVALGLRDSGAAVAVTGRNPNKNAAAAVDFGEQAVFELDVRDEGAVEQTVAEVVRRFGRLDVLVNNAGTGFGGSVTEMEREVWDATIETNLTGSFLCAKHAARRMIAQAEGGKIVNVGSMFSLFGTGTFADYAASKTGVLGLTRSLAIALAPSGIQVNAILPGWFETELTSDLSAERREEIRRRTPAGRFGNLGDLVGTAVFLASRASDFVTGACIPVDGGYSVS